VAPQLEFGLIVVNPIGGWTFYSSIPYSIFSAVSCQYDWCYCWFFPLANS